MTYTPPEFLIDLLNAKSPSGAEGQSQAVFDKYVESHSDSYERDVLGNRIATLTTKVARYRKTKCRRN